ncbi:uncharacterized protein LOC143239378 [Tachypleus tridentatus]|uniref:uncharacterized protein LOC143239378 n=1 Tax=Tachypleus tridentatus TaxID=6853 RepID=UPI003FD3902F
MTMMTEQWVKCFILIVMIWSVSCAAETVKSSNSNAESNRKSKVMDINEGVKEIFSPRLGFGGGGLDLLGSLALPILLLLGLFTFISILPNLLGIVGSSLGIGRRKRSSFDYGDWSDNLVEILNAVQNALEKFEDYNQ